MTQPTIPNTQPNDSEAVSTALETAEALWNRGDPGEALRWLRRAAEAAGDSGDDMRAVALAKAVAELNTSGDKPRLIKPPPLPPKAPPSKAPPAEAEASEQSAGNGAASNEEPARAKPVARPSGPPPAPSSRARASGPAVATPSKAPTVTPRNTSSSSRAPAAQVRSSESAKAASPRRQFARSALRVYVSADGQDGDRLEVHVLNAGQRPPAGAVEAMLVPLRKGAKLLR